jgi:predicted transcriptional regulator of viral defense system
MDYVTIRNALGNRLYFGIKTASEVLGVKTDSARVICYRLARKNLLLRLKRDFYILRERWDNLQYEDLLKIANVLQVPSYISCMSALAFYDVTTQVQRVFFESVSLKRTRVFNPDNAVFNYYKIQSPFYFGFERKEDIFIADKEKAFLDAVYLYSFGKYRFDISSLSMGKLQKAKIIEMLEKYPVKTQKTFKKIWTT